jgi:hypothetical protein
VLTDAADDADAGPTQGDMFPYDDRYH